MQDDTPRGAQQMARRAANPTPISALPPALLLRVLALLPVDTRLRCAEVCRAWRVAVADRSLWTHIRLTAASGIAPRLRYGPLLRAAAARAGGQLRVLDLRDLRWSTFLGRERNELLAVLHANSASLTQLHTPNFCSTGAGAFVEIGELLAAAPALRELHTGVKCDTIDQFFADRNVLTLPQAHHMLRNEPPFGPLRLELLEVLFGREATQEEVVDIAAGARVHSSLRKLALLDAQLRTPAALDAVVDVALALPLTMLIMSTCGLHPGSVPSLVRLLGSPALSCLHIQNFAPLLLDAAAAAQLSVALRANTSLTDLQLAAVDLWHEPEAGAAVVMALVGHPRLHSLRLHFNEVPATGRKVVGHALRALLTANTPAFERLDIGHCQLGDVGMGPLCDALPHNTHLRRLECTRNGISEAFAAERLLPAVQVNTSLRDLRVADERPPAAVVEACRLVEARSAAAAAAPFT